MESPSKSQSIGTDLRTEEEDDDPPLLSSHALAALKEFLAKQIQPSTEPHLENGVSGDSEVALVAEDWRLSQFWYDRDTAEIVANEVLTLCQNFDSPRVACIACPTLYSYLKSFTVVEISTIMECRVGRLEHKVNELQGVFARKRLLLRETVKKETDAAVTKAPLGEVQTERAAELMGFHTCGFRPHHSSKLGN